MISSNITNLIKRHEGCELRTYLCPRGFKTIGWGHKLTAGESYPNGITQDQADNLLFHDLTIAENDCEALFGNFDDLSEGRQGALIDMAFELGRTELSEFHDLIAAVEQLDFAKAVNAMENSLWYSQVRKRAEDDINLMATG